MAEAAAAAGGFSAATFDAADPPAFYLGERREELEALADAVLVVEGTRLPVHTAVLAVASRVLCSAFADLSEGGDASGHKRKRSEGGDLVLESPFEGFSPFEVALFFRLLYNNSWREDIPAALSTVHSSLPALLRLAHRLDTADMLGVLCNCMADAACWSMDALVAWIEAAEECRLNSTLLSLVQKAARLLAGSRDTHSSLAHRMAHARSLERCDKTTLAYIISVLAHAFDGACDGLGFDRLDCHLPSKGATVQACEAAAGTDVLEWTLCNFSQQASEPRQGAASPWFSAAGGEWQFQVYPGGRKPHLQGHVSVVLTCKTPGVHVRVKLAVVGDEGTPAWVLDCKNAAITTGSTDFEWTKVSSGAGLRTAGMLSGDRLRLRATVTKLSG